MRVVIDTNTAISGLLWQGAPREVLNLARAKRIWLYTSSDLIVELDEVLRRPKFASRLSQIDQTVETILRGYAALCTVVAAPPLPQPAASDPDDDAVLACGIAVKATVIVSGDRHLLGMSTYAGIPILDVHQFLQQVESAYHE